MCECTVEQVENDRQLSAEAELEPLEGAGVEGACLPPKEDILASATHQLIHGYPPYTEEEDEEEVDDDLEDPDYSPEDGDEGKPPNQSINRSINQSINQYSQLILHSWGNKKH